MGWLTWKLETTLDRKEMSIWRTTLSGGKWRKGESQRRAASSDALLAEVMATKMTVLREVFQNRWPWVQRRVMRASVEQAVETTVELKQ